MKRVLNPETSTLHPRGRRVGLRTKLGMVALAGTLAVSMNGASAAANPMEVIAGPLAASVNYTTTTVILIKGNTLFFQNYDIQRHDVVSPIGLFTSAKISFGQRTQVNGVGKLKRGKSYRFICTLHSGMKGTIRVP